MLNELLILRYYSWADSFGGPLFTPPIVRAWMLLKLFIDWPLVRSIYTRMIKNK
jgi:hypothetical protein